MNKHKWSEDEVEFLRMYAHGHSYVEITEEINRVFGLELEVRQIKAALKNRKIRTGRTGRFGSEGNTNAKKWAKGECAPGVERTWFKKGDIPSNHKPVGSERITKDGYIMVKVAEPNKYRLKHRVVYEEAYGEIPDDLKVTFIDGDKHNCDISNLMPISKAAHIGMVHRKYWGTSGDTKVAAVNTCELIAKINEKLKGE